MKLIQVYCIIACIQVQVGAAITQTGIVHVQYGVTMMVIDVTWPLGRFGVRYLQREGSSLIYCSRADGMPGVIQCRWGYCSHRVMLPPLAGSHRMCPAEGSSMTRGGGVICVSAWRIEGDSSLQGLRNRILAVLKGKGRSRGRLSAYSSSLTHLHTPTQLRMSASCTQVLGQVDSQSRRVHGGWAQTWTPNL